MKVTSGSKICSTLKREKERERDIIIYISSKISHSSLVLTSGSNKTNLFNPPCNNVRALYIVSGVIKQISLIPFATMYDVYIIGILLIISYHDTNNFLLHTKITMLLKKSW